MVNPISSATTSHASETAKAAAPKPQQQQNSPQPSDTVTLKSTNASTGSSASH
jgi:hypothetical protein